MNLVFTSSYFFVMLYAFSIAGSNSDTIPLKKAVEEYYVIEDKIQKDFRSVSGKPIERIIISLGAEGEGKSTVNNFLSLRELRTRTIRGILKICVEKPIVGMEVVHTPTQRIGVPYSKYDHRTKSVFYDTPGLTSSENVTSQLRNFLLIKKIFEVYANYPIYILIVTSEESLQLKTGAWITTVVSLCSLFGSSFEDFSKAVSIVITKSKFWNDDIHGDAHARNTLLGSLSEEADRNTRYDATMNNLMVKCVERLATVPLIFFPAAKHEGILFNIENCDSLRRKIFKGLHATTPLIRLIPIADLSESEKLHVTLLITELIAEVAHFTQSILEEKTAAYCKELCKAKSSDHARKDLMRFITALENIQRGSEDIAQGFKDIFMLVGAPYIPHDDLNIASRITYLADLILLSNSKSQDLLMQALKKVHVIVSDCLQENNSLTVSS